MENSQQKKERIAAMREGGKRLGDVRDRLAEFARVGMSFAEIEAEAQRLIRTAGAIPNFALVPRYHWATCIMKNDEVCHGIPSKEKIIHDGDLIKIDVGLLYQKYNVDTTTSLVVGKSTPAKDRFLEIGRRSLEKAIAEVQPGASVYDLSVQMQKTVEKHGYGAVYQLTGHGIGLELHEDPAIPCVAHRGDKRIRLEEGQTIAVEIMYAMGDPALKVDSDGWTYRTTDGSLGGMFEETVLVTRDGFEILTQ